MKNIWFIHILWLILLTSCADYAPYKKITEDLEIPSKIFVADKNLTWSAVIDVLSKYDIEIQNRNAGFIKTSWIDNTLDVNFTDSFGGSDKIKTAKFKLIVNVIKGFRDTFEVSKVTVYKRQLVEQDFLQGWKEVQTDGILENTLLYRIDRKITIDKELNKIQEQKEKELIQKF
jgi:hypothetical protein